MLTVISINQVVLFQGVVAECAVLRGSGVGDGLQRGQKWIFSRINSVITLQLEESENDSVVRILVNKHDDDTQDQKEQQGDREGAGQRASLTKVAIAAERALAQASRIVANASIAAVVLALNNLRTLLALSKSGNDK